MSMSISAVVTQLETFARTNESRVIQAPSINNVVQFAERARMYREMAATVRGLATSWADSQSAVVVTPAKRTRTTTKAAAPKAAPMNALTFWRLHGQAVDQIRAVYGDRWKITAPFGSTELCTLASGYRSAKTERGVTLRWSRDQRIPAARYWPGGLLPTGVTVEADYARHVPGQAVTRDSAWYESRGYAQNTKGEWVFELELRANEMHREAGAAALAAKASVQGFGMVPDWDGNFDRDDLAEAAD